MKNKTAKRAVALLLAALMIYPSLLAASFAAGNSPTVSLGAVEAQAGATQVKVPVSLSNVPSEGVEEVMLTLTYDTTVLTCTGAEVKLTGIGMNEMDYSDTTYPPKYLNEDGGYLMVDFYMEDESEVINANGVVLYLVFSVASTAAAEKYDIQVKELSQPASGWAAQGGSITVTGGSEGGGDEDAGSTAGGSIKADGYTVYWGYGGSVAPAESSGYTITADNGYAIDEIWVDGQRLESGYDAYHNQASYTYNGPPANSVVVYFAYTLTFKGPDHGTLSVFRNGVKLKSGSIVHGGDVLQINYEDADGCGKYVLDEETLQTSGLTGINYVEDTGYVVSAKKDDPTPAVSASVKEAGNDQGEQEQATYYLQVQSSIANGEVTLSWGSDGNKTELSSESSAAAGLRAKIPAGTTVTVTATPKPSCQLTRLAYSYSYPTTPTSGTEGGISPGLAQDENLDSTKAITTTFTMPEANVYVTAAFDAASTVTGASADKLNANTGKYEVSGGEYAISRVSAYSNTDVGAYDFAFPEDKDYEEGAEPWNSASKGVCAVTLGAETVKVTVSPGAGFFVRA